MKHARVNVSFLVRTGVALAVLAGLVHLVHAWQMTRHAGDQLARANQVERDNHPDELVRSLGRSLAFEPGNHAVRARHALALADHARTLRQRWKALQALLEDAAQDPHNDE